MSERMTPIPFAQLMTWLTVEHEKSGSAFGVTHAYHAPEGETKKTLPLFSEKLETPFGPAAGPNTQLAQNIIAGYFAGARFFELKTVQKMDGEELAACINRPCILAADEGYNCEWSTELTVPAAMAEYVKAWVALKFISRKWNLGSPDGFMFNMSVGYDLAGIKTPKLDAFIEGLKDAAETEVFQECLRVLLAQYPEDAGYIEAISPHICAGVTVSTLHGCPPQEIEAIASYLIREKHLNTFVKCNPTILGYTFARETLDAMGYDYIAFDEHHFNEDLQYSDAVPMFRRLLALAAENGLEFGLKLSNTFPVDVKQDELPSSEMYMSGKALYPLTIEMANRITRDFSGKLRLSFSGGADYFNIEKLFEAGIWPITVATTILKPGGYNRFAQLAELFESLPYAPFTGVNREAVARLSEEARSNPRHLKAIKPLPSRKRYDKVPLFDCFTAPCKAGCPIEQDIPEYLELTAKGEYLAALRLITEKNALPFITGAICAHHCMDKCQRNYYEDAVHIRACKLYAAERGYDALLSSLAPVPVKAGAPRTAIIGGGPAGLAAAYFLSRAGYPVTVFEKREKLGGIVRNVIPAFRIADETIDRDVAMIQKLGGEFVLGKEAPDLAALKAAGYTYVLLAFGAERRGKLDLPGSVMNVIDFLQAAKHDPASLALGRHVVVVGGGNTAMDAARAAKRLPGVERVSIAYRRTRRYMPADAEELELAMADGVEFDELLSPVSQENGMLLCKKMVLGAPDSSGRRSPVETEETVLLPCDTVIAAVGEKPDPAAFARYGVTLDAKGHAAQRYDNVFVAGDALRGPATVVEAIADAAAFAETVAGEHRYTVPAAAAVEAQNARARKGRLAARQTPDASRCLACGAVCETCVSVCPNRANVAISVPGCLMGQILHVDYLCNECGNCAVFCPYDSAPYKEKFTYFRDEKDFLDSENSGFVLLNAECDRVRVRLDGKVSEHKLAEEDGLDEAVKTVIQTVLKDYAYII